MLLKMVVRSDGRAGGLLKFGIQQSEEEKTHTHKFIADSDEGNRIKSKTNARSKPLSPLSKISFALSIWNLHQFIFDMCVHNRKISNLCKTFKKNRMRRWTELKLPVYDRKFNNKKKRNIKTIKQSASKLRLFVNKHFL